MKRYFLTIDLGASSGRLIVTEIIKTADKLKQHEVYRFKNAPKMNSSRKVWDIESIMSEILFGLNKAFELYPSIESIGIDSFGVDFGLLDKNNKLIRNPISYRDLTHINENNNLHKRISIEELYNKSGIQKMDFNSIYQLYYLANFEYEIYKKVKTILLIPDLIAFYLTDQMRIEVTNLSTTSIYNIEKSMYIEGLDKLNIDVSKFPEIITPEEKYGFLSKKIMEICDVKHKVRVVAVCTHDTASSVLTVPEDNIYISSGTWSLVGTVINRRNISKQSFNDNFTNEVGYKNTIRYLKNTMGLWLLNHFIREYKKENSNFDYLEYLKQIDMFEENTPMIDIDSTEYYDGENVSDKIANYLKETNQNYKIPKIEYIKIILFSMALKYRYIIEKIEKNTNKLFNDITIIGGGNQIECLNKLTSDICQKNVIVGYKEATALGNSIVLMLESKCITRKEEAFKYLDAEFKKYEPKRDFESVYVRYLSLIKGVNHG